MGPAFRASFPTNERSEIMTEFSRGDKVTWKFHSGEGIGVVQAKITSNDKVAGRRVRASVDSPQYLVENEMSGDATAHRPSALRHAE